MRVFRKLNDEGLDEFETWLAAGAPGEVPVHLLSGPTTSVPVPNVTLGRPETTNRYEFGQWLNAKLAAIDSVEISVDRHLWSSLALLFFDHICPPLAGGRRLDKMYRYVLSTDYRHYYRHLVRTPWQLVRDHGENARLLLLPVTDRPYPLRIHGEILEQLGGRQSVLRSRPLIAEASRLYSDPKTGRPRPRVASKNMGGTVRRLGAVLRQFDLTYDVENLGGGELLQLLPREFDRWKAEQAVPRAA
ncbi:MAG TPA: hypothetical protein VIT38_14050 [Allosphingosinicella sp.]